jgi:hypothetical protein
MLFDTYITDQGTVALTSDDRGWFATWIHTGEVIGRIDAGEYGLYEASAVGVEEIKPCGPTMMARAAEWIAAVTTVKR